MKLYGKKPDFMASLSNPLVVDWLMAMYPPAQKLELSAAPSSFFPGVDLISGYDEGNGIGGLKPYELYTGTIRMGYGHHRMAFSVYSQAVERGITTALHDLLAIHSNEATCIERLDSLYSQFSRMATELGGPVEWAWGKAMTGGGIGALHFSMLLAGRLIALYSGMDRDTPIITTYPLNAHVASALGFRRIVHLVNDTLPQYFLLAPGALNLVQTRHMRDGYLEMGVPEEEVDFAGHWVSEPVLSTLENAVADRMNRLDKKERLRLLISVGGAGAQKKFLKQWIGAILDDASLRSAFVPIINCGDHQDFFDTMQEMLERRGHELQVKVCRSICDVQNLPAILEDFDLVLFHFESRYEAVYATDYAIVYSDVLATKPSELAFYPIPRLFLRRVGDHEGYSADYGFKLGEATAERRSVQSALEDLQTWKSDNSALKGMNEVILANHGKGLYGGATMAIERALSTD
ncbi:MAG: hypothetical protein KDK25_10100 [Leptospiraceae bacterium]|nr:hypothetical protein [Leptospiraceae bacterium]MCB1170677.1 hypothetical protein [Leptospiraceae bacterium]